MNLFVADPHWGWWIVLYFFLGGIAAGLYFLSALIVLFGTAEDAQLVRPAHLLAFPLIALCGIFLIVDLDRPERFWHMLFQSEVVKEALAAGWPQSGEGWASMLSSPLFKPWSPMSIGAWAVAIFGLLSFLSFLAALWPNGGFHHLLLFSAFGKVYQLIGAGVGFFVAAYTGTLLTASNQPVWAASEWIGALFLTSAASTAIAVLVLLTARRANQYGDSLERLERAELWTEVLELAVFSIFLVSLGPALFLLLDSWHGRLLIFGTLLLSIITPLYLQMVVRDKRRPVAAALSALAGGLVLRYAILYTPGELLAINNQRVFADDMDTLTRTWSWVFFVSMLLLLGLICVTLYRRFGQEGRDRALVVGLFTITLALLVLHTVTTYDQRQQVWASLPINLSPEVGRPRGGGPGASDFNRTPNFHPRSKVYGKDAP